jgi:hypothetical protein
VANAAKQPRGKGRAKGDVGQRARTECGWATVGMKNGVAALCGVPHASVAIKQGQQQGVVAIREWA